MVAADVKLPDSASFKWSCIQDRIPVQYFGKIACVLD